MPNPWIILAVVAALISAGLTGYFKGRRDEKADYVAAALEAEKNVVQKTQQAAVITEDVGKTVAEKTETVREVTRDIIKWRTKYVPVVDPDSCSVSNLFVWMHDAAASGRAAVPDGARQPPGDPSGVKTATVRDTVVANYGTCQEVRTELKGWQDWYADQRSAWSK